MQTFFTSLDLDKSAHSLWENGRWPGNRLFNQVNEGLVILRTNTGWYEKEGRKGWPHHPATRMWKGYELYLAKYISAHIDTYAELSGKDCYEKRQQVIDALKSSESVMKEWEDWGATAPPWLTEEFASNHRAVLLGKAWEAVNHLDKRIKKYQELREQVIIGTVEEMAFTKEINKSYRKYQKACDVLKWYQSLGWQEKPAERVLVGGRYVWPYIWPESEEVQ